MRVRPATVLTLWTEDAYGGRITSKDDVASVALDTEDLNPQTGPFWIEGAEPGDTLAVHLVDLTPARSWGASTLIPFFGGLTSVPANPTLQSPLPERTWIYEYDSADDTVGIFREGQQFRAGSARQPDARHGRGRTGAPRGTHLTGTGCVRRQHGYTRNVVRRNRVIYGSTFRARCSRSATAITAKAKASPAVRRSKAR